jgi:hypothetical protein
MLSANFAVASNSDWFEECKALNEERRKARPDFGAWLGRNFVPIAEAGSIEWRSIGPP